MGNRTAAVFLPHRSTTTKRVALIFLQHCSSLLHTTQGQTDTQHDKGKKLFQHSSDWAQKSLIMYEYDDNEATGRGKF